ncbi:MAG: carbohydrate-binding protein [Rhizobiaceae bacterium]
MAILPDYTTGTITLTSGSKDFTTSGSALQSKQVRSGDMIYSPVTGLFLLIDAITGENSGTLAYNCPAAAAVTDGPLRVRFQPDVSRYTAALYDVLDKLKSGNVDALAGLIGSAGKIPQFTGAGAMQLADYLVFNFRDDWATAQDYVVNDIVKQGGNTYICVVAHTSGTFATDLAAGKWDLFVPKGSDADIAADTHAATSKGTPVDADELPIADSAASFGLKKLTWANVKATLKTYLDTLYLSTTLARREVLTANRTYYVRATGNNANDGLTAGTAFLTIQNAVNVALALDMSIYSVTIDVGAGTFNEGGFLSVAGNGNARITIQGAGYTSTIIAGTTYGIQPKNGVALTLMNLAIQGNTVCLWPRYGAQVFLGGNISLNGGTARLIGIDNGAYLECIGSAVLYLAADSTYAFYADVLGHILIWATVKTTGPRTFTQTARAQGGGVLELGGTTFDLTAGAVTGTRYAAALNGLINTAGGGANFIPGTVAGSPAVGTVGTTGGVYA